VVATVLSDAPKTEQQVTTGPYYDGTLDKNELHQRMDEEIQQREWTNKLVVYKYRLIRLARLGISQYKLKAKAANIHNSDEYTYVAQQNKVPFDSTRTYSYNVYGNNNKLGLAPPNNTAGLRRVLSERGAVQEPNAGHNGTNLGPQSGTNGSTRMGTNRR
jgi:hypothetical protein